MNLSDKTILSEMENGNITISPFDMKYLNPNSVDLTLNKMYKVLDKKNAHKLSTIERENLYASVNLYTEEQRWEMNPNMSNAEVDAELDRIGFPSYYVDCKKENKFMEFTMPEDGMILVPGELYIYSCNEVIGCKKNIRAGVMGKSSMGRLGLFVHVTAGFVDTGFQGSLVLEMVATIPIKIYPNQKICQIEFVRVEGEFLETYDQKEGSKYMNQTGAQESKMHKNF
jgi:dCTP deaminase